MSTPHPAPAPTPTMLHGVRKCDGETTRKHIVMLKPGASKAELLAKLSAMNADITHDWDFINAFAGASESCRFSKFSSTIFGQLCHLLIYTVIRTFRWCISQRHPQRRRRPEHRGERRVPRPIQAHQTRCPAQACPCPWHHSVCVPNSARS